MLASQIKKLQVAFPGQDTDFFNLLAERLVANRFSDRRLREAVSHMIDTFPYRRINIADVISFDRRVRLYTYGEVCDMVHGQTARFDEFELREVGSKKYWIRKTESKPPCTKSAWV